MTTTRIMGVRLRCKAKGADSVQFEADDDTGTVLVLSHGARHIVLGREYDFDISLVNVNHTITIDPTGTIAEAPEITSPKPGDPS